MITLPSATDQQRVLDAAFDDMEIALLINGEDVTGPFEEGEWGPTDIPITLDATIAAMLPPRLENGEVQLLVRVGGVIVPQLLSAKSTLVQADEPGRVDLIATTPGGLLNGDDAIKLGAFTNYSGLSPESIIREILLRLPYDKSLLRIAPSETPPLTFEESGEQPGFEAEEATGAVLARVGEESGYVFHDTPQKGHRAYVPEALAVGQEAVLRFHFSELIEWTPPVPAEARYYDVRVFKRNPDGSLAFESIERVSYHGRPPLPGQTLNVVLEDSSPYNAENARKRAVKEALDQARALYTSDEFTLPYFFPLLQVDDRMLVEEDYRDYFGDYWQREWLYKIDTYKHAFGGATSSEGLLDTLVTPSAILTQQDLIKAPGLIVPGPSGGVVPTSAPALGSDALGFWFIPEIAVGWVVLDGTGAWVDPELARGHVDHDGSGFSFDVSTAAVAVPSVDPTGEDEGGWFLDLDAVGSLAGEDEEGWYIDLDSSGEFAGEDEEGLWILDP